MSESQPPDPRADDFESDIAPLGTGFVSRTDPGPSTGPVAGRVASFRFGLKSMAVLTVIAALIFLMINLNGPLYGLLISFAAVLIGQATVFFGGLIAYQRVDNEYKRMLNSWLLASCLFSVGLFLGVCFAGGGQAATYFLNEVAIKKKYSSELGFTFDSEQHFINDVLVTTIRITSVSPGGEFERAGFLIDDVIFDYNKQEFFDKLQSSSGEEMTVNVVTAGTSYQANQLDKLPQRAVTFKVP